MNDFNESSKKDGEAIETEENAGAEGYINLKEAARISGYAPDYVGQLIRKGKISGKRIYTNVAWVTTKDAVLGYLKQSHEGESAPKGHNSRRARLEFENIFENKKFLKAFRAGVYALLAIVLLAAILLFYVFSSVMEKKFSDQAIKKSAEEAAALKAK